MYKTIFLFVNIKGSETPFTLSLPCHLKCKLALAHSLTGSFPAKAGYMHDGSCPNRSCLQDRLIAMNSGHQPD